MLKFDNRYLFKAKFLCLFCLVNFANLCCKNDRHKTENVSVNNVDLDINKPEVKRIIPNRDRKNYLEDISNPLVGVTSSEVLFDGDYKPRITIKVKNNGRMGISGFFINIISVDSRTGQDNCGHPLQIKRTIPANRVFKFTYALPEDDGQACPFNEVRLELIDVVLSDGRKLDQIGMLLEQSKLSLKKK